MIARLPSVISSETTPRGERFLAYICVACMDAQKFKRPKSIYPVRNLVCERCKHYGWGADLVVSVGDWLEIKIDPDQKAADEPRKPHKYKAIPKTTADGIRHQSTAEARRWDALKLLERAGAISNLQRQVAFPLLVNGVQIGKYVADFVYFWPNSERVIEDVKGVETPLFRRSAKHMAAQGDPVTVYPPKPKKARKKA